MADLVVALFRRTRPAPILRRYLDAKAIHEWGFRSAFARKMLDSITRMPHIIRSDIAPNWENRDRDSAAYGVDPFKPHDLRIPRDGQRTRSDPDGPRSWRCR